MKNRIIIIFCFILLIASPEVRSQDIQPQVVAQGQLDAYNNQDIEAFLSWYADDVQVFNFPDELIYKGIDKMRERYSNAWKQNPNQKARVLNRIVNGNTVIDKEFVTGRANGIENNVIAIYRIDHGKISKVYFIRD